MAYAGWTPQSCQDDTESYTLRINELMRTPPNVINVDMAQTIKCWQT
jgi:hypothetical protein